MTKLDSSSEFRNIRKGDIADLSHKEMANLSRLMQNVQLIQGKDILT